MFEKLLAAILGLTAAFEANTAALTGKAAPKAGASDDDGDDTTTKPQTAAQKKAAAAAAAKAKKGSEDDDGDDTPVKPKKVTRDMVNAILNKVKEDLGAPVAKGIIAKLGVEKMAEIEDEDLDAAYKAAKAKLDKAAADGAGDDDGI